MVCGIAAGTYLISTDGVAWKVDGLATIAGALAVVPPFVAPSSYGGLPGKGLAIVWNLQLVYAITQVVFSRTESSVEATES